MRPIVRLLIASSPAAVDAALLGLRLYFGLVLAFAHGWGKVSDLGAFVLKVKKLGFPLPELLGPAAALSEFLGGILLALGLLTRVSAVFVATTMLTAAFYVHADDPFARKELALAFALAALAVLAAGPGRLSLDHRLFSSRS